ncbi:hypothetical protein LTR95_000337 [Oleoguttula sp. CCFEE 5521]
MLRSSLVSLAVTAATVTGLALDPRATTPYDSTWHPSTYTTAQVQSLLSQKLTCCTALSVVFGSKVSYPNSTTYDASLLSYWSIQEEEVTPTCVFTPSTKEDVSLAVFVLNVGGKVFPGRCNFAVRSGGHTPFAGAANIEEGVTIDLKNLNSVVVSADRTTVNIGPANRWQNVYSQLDAQGLSTSGGRVATVGAGGLITGGGISFFSPRYGFVCDNVLSFEVVLASGQIVNANATSNPDLWRSLRGGSNNFGIVTNFKMRAFAQGEFWGGYIGLTVDSLQTQLQAFEDFTGSPNYDPYASLIYSLVLDPASGTWSVACSIEYTKSNPAVVNPPYFQNFTSLPQTFSTLRVSSLTDKTVELAYSNPIGFRQLFATGTYGNSAKQMLAIYQAGNSTVQSIRNVPGLQWSLSYQPEPTIITSKAATDGGNSLGLDVSDGNLVNVLLTATWNNTADDARVNAAAKALFSQAGASAKKLGVTNPYLYLNYAAPWQDPIAGYGAANVAALKAASAKYDPSGVFQKQVPGGFKLK